MLLRAARDDDAPTPPPINPAGVTPQANMFYSERSSSCMCVSLTLYALFVCSCVRALVLVVVRANALGGS